MTKVVYSLDLATQSGVAKRYNDNPIIYTWVHKGTPVQGLANLMAHVVEDGADEIEFMIEDHFHFRNASTTRKLISRIGYYYWSLVANHYKVTMIHPGEARHFIGATSKDSARDILQAIAEPWMGGKSKLLDDHSDACNILIFNQKLNWRDLKINICPTVSDVVTKKKVRK